jgi:tRNA nucleotidyltransferase (CCA-adding enzyme)
MSFITKLHMKPNINKNSIPKEVVNISEILKNAGFETYLVGGSVRDLLLGLEPKDWDFCTSATPEQIVALFPRTFYENDFGTVGVVSYETDVELENCPETLKVIEVTPFRGESEYSDGRRPDRVTFGVSLQEDLARRDFTINAIAYDVSHEKIIDPFEGLKDLKDKNIRTVGNPDDRFGEDSLRLLRAVRIATQLEFNVSPETISSIIKNKEGIKRVSRERVRDELIKLFMCNTPMLGFIMLEYTGLLEFIMPELRFGIGMKQTQAHAYDVWGHLLRSLQCAADKNMSLDLRIAALLHDIAKPHTARKKPKSDENTFYGHDVVGERVSREILERLKFPKTQTEKICKLVRWHMFFSDPEAITLSAVRRMIANVSKENIWDLMDLRICDRIGTGRPKEDPYRLRKYHAMIEECLRDPLNVQMLKIDGKKIMEVTQETPGPRLGLLLNALMGIVFDNPEDNTEEKLVSHVTKLAKLDTKELAKLAEKGKDDLKAKDEEVLREINAKHRVK